jgi:7,8-dihydroneopterin aldolase/epimerase/oxygenase
MIIEVRGLRLSGRHGVDEDERAAEQAFLVDLMLHVQEPTGDSLAATFDYRRARDLVSAVNERASYQLLETFAAAIADALIAEPAVERVVATVRKPGIAWAEWTAATAERS